MNLVPNPLIHERMKVKHRWEISRNNYGKYKIPDADTLL